MKSKPTPMYRAARRELRLQNSADSFMAMARAQARVCGVESALEWLAGHYGRTVVRVEELEKQAKRRKPNR